MEIRALALPCSSPPHHPNPGIRSKSHRPPMAPMACLLHAILSHTALLCTIMPVCRAVLRVLVSCLLAWLGLSPALSCPLAQLQPTAHYHLPTLGGLPLSLSLLLLLPASGVEVDGWPPMKICRDVMSHIMHRGAAVLPLLRSYLPVDGTLRAGPYGFSYVSSQVPLHVLALPPCLKYLAATTSTEDLPCPAPSVLSCLLPHSELPPPTPA
ncbi:hypothetical protein F5Y03DRAFT_311514 [Xylaria venustula]|nr:hypothetical protein F5Y03DRAFT_311514 [Xylaria venustula]